MNIQAIPWEYLTKSFTEGVAELINEVKGNIPVKTVNNYTLSGRMFLNLTIEFLSIIN